MIMSSAVLEPRSGTSGVSQVPGRGDWVAAWLLLVVDVAAVVMAVAALARAHELRPTAAAAPPAARVAYTAEDVAAATAKTCAIWWTASEALNDAANAVIDTPEGWDNPVRQAARAHEADVSLTQTAYLKDQVAPAAPAELRRLIDQYNALTFAKLDASVHRLGTQVDALIAQQNGVMRDIDAKCEK